MFTPLLKLIESHDVIIIHRHNRPDGDALGSQIGMKHLLQENFPHKQIYMVGDAAGYLSFMEGCVMDEVPDAVYHTFTFGPYSTDEVLDVTYVEFTNQPALIVVCIGIDNEDTE